MVYTYILFKATSIVWIREKGICLVRKIMPRWTFGIWTTELRVRASLAHFEVGGLTVFEQTSNIHEPSPKNWKITSIIRPWLLGLIQDAGTCKRPDDANLQQTDI